MSEKNDIIKVSSYFKMLSNPTRLSIIFFLLDGERTVKDICNSLGFDQSLVSHNLRQLKDNNLVKCVKKGKESYYSIKDEHIETILVMSKNHISCR